MSIALLQVVASMAVGLAGSAGVGAVDAVEAAAPSHPCAAITEPSKRLACYDAAFPPAGTAGSQGLGLEEQKRKALRDFGLDQVQLRERDPERMRELSPDRIEAGVADVALRSTGHRVVTLDNGQVWLLTEVSSKGYLASGDRVTIRKAALGNYMLLTPQRVPLRARRIQ